MDKFTRRSILIGGTVGVAVGGVNRSIAAARLFIPTFEICKSPAQPVFFQGWLAAMTAGLAANWLVEVLKNYGLVPGLSSAVSSSVGQAHATGQDDLATQGYAVNRVYQGSYSGGDVAVSGAFRGNEYSAFASSDHGDNTCTLAYMLPDICALHAVTHALTEEDHPQDLIEACTFPVHGAKYGLYDQFGHSSWRFANTPNNGSLDWLTRDNGGQLQVSAQLRSDDLNADITAVREPGRWKYAYDRV